MNRKLMALTLAAAITASALGVTALAAEGDAPDTQDPAVSASTQTQQTITEEETTLVDAAAEGEEKASQDIQNPADAQGNQPAPEGSGEQAEPVDVAQDPVGTISFANLGQRMRSNNLNLLALEETISSIDVIDYDKMTDDLREALNAMAEAQWLLIGFGKGDTYTAGSLNQAYTSLEATFDDLKDGKLQEDNAALIRQLRNAQDQVVMAGESLYVALVGMENTDQTLRRSLSALDRTVQEMELRYNMGQISALTLQEVKAGRTSLVSSQQTLDMNIENYKIQLELLIGAELTGKIQLQTLPQVTDDQLAAMNLEADLAAAKQTSYELLAAQRSLDDAEETFDDAVSEYGYSSKKYQFASAKHTWQAAQHTYAATIQNFETSFRTLFLQVKDYKQILDAAKVTLACEQDNYASAQLKYEQGSLSKNKLLDAQDEVAAAQDTVDTAAINLFSAYNNYRWAVDYGILN